MRILYIIFKFEYQIIVTPKPFLSANCLLEQRKSDIMFNYEVIYKKCISIPIFVNFIQTQLLSFASFYERQKCEIETEKNLSQMIIQ